MMKNRKDIFWKVYAIAAAAAICILGIGLVVFYDFMEAYEISQPSAAANAYASSITEQTIQTLMLETIREIPPMWETEEQAVAMCAASMEKGSYTSRRIFLSEAVDKTVFGLYCNDKLLAHMYLESHPDGRYGFFTWEVEDVRFLQESLPAGKQSCTIYAPSDSAVFVNGIPVSEDWIVTKQEPYVYLTEFEKDASIFYTVYEIRGMYGEPTITCSQQDDACALVKEAQDYYFLYPNSALHTYSVTAPDGCTVLLNGKVVDESYVTDERILYTYADIEKDALELPAAVRYTIPGLFAEPQVTVTGDHSNLPVQYDAENHMYTVQYPEEWKYSCVITVPKGSTVTMRGVDCTPYQIQVPEGPIVELYAELGAPSAWDQYRIDGLYLMPDAIEVTYDGNLHAGVYAAEGKEYTYTAEYPNTFREDIKELALNFSKAYFQYTSQGYNNLQNHMQNVLQYTAQNSDAAIQIASAQIGLKYVTPATSTVYNVLEVQKVAEIAPGAYVCSVEFDIDQQVYYVKQAYSGTFTLYIDNYYGVPRVYGMYMENHSK